MKIGDRMGKESGGEQEKDRRRWRKKGGALEGRTIIYPEGKWYYRITGLL